MRATGTRLAGHVVALSLFILIVTAGTLSAAASTAGDSYHDTNHRYDASTDLPLHAVEASNRDGWTSCPPAASTPPLPITTYSYL